MIIFSGKFSSNAYTPESCTVKNTSESSYEKYDNDNNNIGSQILKTNNGSIVLPAKNYIPFSNPLWYTTANIKLYKFGIRILEMNNICYDLQTKKFDIFINRGDSTKTTNTINRFHDFITTNKLYKTIENEIIYNKTKNIWIIHAAYDYQIAHFQEAANNMITIANHPELFPKVDMVLWPTRTNKVYSWIQEYTNLIHELYPSTVPFYRNNDIYRIFGNRFCLEHVDVVHRIMNPLFGNIFADPIEAYYVRVLAYKYIGYDIASKKYTVPYVTIVNRTPRTNLYNRQIRNIDEIMREFNSSFSGLFNCRSELIIMDFLKLQEVVSIMVKTDILVGAVGSGLINSLFMLPFSVVIMFFPTTSQDHYFYNLSYCTDIYILPSYNASLNHYPSPKFDNCNKTINKYGVILNNYTCNHFAYMDDVYISPNILYHLLYIANLYLKQKKYFIQYEF
ncbi:hypothetical protein WA158_007524 [Blastocystis sp. Blastoise]